MTFNGSKFELPRGTNDNIVDNIVGDYIVTGSVGIDNLGNPQGANGLSVVFSNQNGFSINKLLASYYEFDNSVLTGFSENKVGIVHNWDYAGDSNPERIVFSNITILENGNLQVDRLELFSSIDSGRQWERYTETLEKQ